MDSLEICKRIAEIDGEIVSVKQMPSGLVLFYGAELEDRRPKYNPLTDDALCFQLMIKYKIDVVWVSSLLNNDDRVYAKNTALSNLVNEKPNRGTNKAICLAIIEAHKDD